MFLKLSNTKIFKLPRQRNCHLMFALLPDSLKPIRMLPQVISTTLIGTFLRLMPKSSDQIENAQLSEHVGVSHEPCVLPVSSEVVSASDNEACAHHDGNGQPDNDLEPDVDDTHAVVDMSAHEVQISDSTCHTTTIDRKDPSNGNEEEWHTEQGPLEQRRGGMGDHQQEGLSREKDGQEGRRTPDGQAGVVQQGDESRTGKGDADLKEGTSEDSTSGHVTGLQTLLPDANEESTRILDQMPDVSSINVSTVVTSRNDVAGQRIEADGGVRRSHRRSAPVWTAVEKRVLSGRAWEKVYDSLRKKDKETDPNYTFRSSEFETHHGSLHYVRDRYQELHKKKVASSKLDAAAYHHWSSDRKLKSKCSSISQVWQLHKVWTALRIVDRLNSDSSVN